MGVDGANLVTDEAFDKAVAVEQDAKVRHALEVALVSVDETSFVSWADLERWAYEVAAKANYARLHPKSQPFDRMRGMRFGKERSKHA